jgi:hypothetical protein
MPDSNLPAPEQLREMDERFAVEPPRMTVLSDHPILREDDKDIGQEPDSFGLRARLGAVYDIIRHKNTRAPIAIAIYGDWGTGKSSAMRWLRDQLDRWSKQTKQERAGHMKARTVWFDPWKYQEREDVWRGLIAEVILNSIDVKKASLATVTNAAKKFGLFLGRGFLNVLSSAKLKAGAKQIGGEVEVNLDVLKKIAEDYHETAHPEKAYLNEFESALKNWVSDSLAEDERMLIFIDDLDRCLPEVTFEVLEALKLYLNIPKLIFVVGLDRRVVESYVKHHYKKDEVDDSKARHYLDKMFQVEVEIPPSQTQIEGYLPKQIETLNKACDNYWSGNLDGAWEGRYREVIEDHVRRLAKHNPREIKRLLNSTLLRATAASRNETLAGTEPERFTQGAQVFLIQRVLRRDVPNSTSLMLEKRTLEFFAQWSHFVGNNPEFRELKETTSSQQKATLTVNEWMASRQSASGRPNRSIAGQEALLAPEKAATDAYDILRESQPRYGDKDEVYPLLQNYDLWDLMRIPFSTSVAATTADQDKQERPRRPEPVGSDSVISPHVAAPPTTPAEPRRVLDMPRAVLSAIATSLKKDVDRVSEDDFVAVRDLDLPCADVRTVSSLAWLEYLESLNLAANPVDDVSALASLQNLQSLDLGATGFQDVSSLASLQKLRSLTLRHTYVSDISSLADLQNLQYLDLTATPVSDVSSLANLQNLGRVDLCGTAVSDVSSLANLQNLQWLDLGRTAVSDVSSLANLQNLQWLGLVETRVSLDQVDKLKKSRPNLVIDGP